MTTGRQFVTILVALVLLTGMGCQKKAPQIPGQAKAPAEPIPTPLPPEITEETPPPPPPKPAPAPPKVEEPKPQPAKHRKKKPSQPPATAQSSEATTASSSAGSGAVASARPPANPANEAPPDTAIAANVSSAQLMQQKQTTAQLLDATEKTLNGLPRNLSGDEKELVAQIRSYLTQSRKATTDGDFERAYNLATKAHLLSDALVKK